MPANHGLCFGGQTGTARPDGLTAIVCPTRNSRNRVLGTLTPCEADRDLQSLAFSAYSSNIIIASGNCLIRRLEAISPEGVN